MTEPNLSTCIDNITRTIDAIAFYDDPQLPDEKRVLARLAIHHLEIARGDIEKLKRMLETRS
jgi:hypothetical protein